jgi:hypothetical protein
MFPGASEATAAIFRGRRSPEGDGGDIPEASGATAATFQKRLV